MSSFEKMKSIEGDLRQFFPDIAHTAIQKYCPNTLQFCSIAFALVLQAAEDHLQCSSNFSKLLMLPKFLCNFLIIHYDETEDFFNTVTLNPKNCDCKP